MPNLGSLLKQEIARIARREMKSHISAARKASAQQRHHIASLRRRIDELERRIARLVARPAPTPADANAPAVAEARIRFAPKGLRSMRERLDLSADRFARLLGVSAQTVYNWEHRVTTPRARQIQAIAALRGIGKREALARLESLGANPVRRGPSRAPAAREAAAETA